MSESRSTRRRRDRENHRGGSAAAVERSPSVRVAAVGNGDRRPARQAGAPRWIVGLAAAVVVLIVAVMVLVRVGGLGRGLADARQPVSPTVERALTGVPAAVANQIGQGSVTALPVRVTAPVLRDARGRPRIIYIGAEYCPYCAAQRWALIVALSRFGTFSNLSTARSAADDVYPLTPTFTFYGAHYQSDRVSFEAVELQSSTRVGGQYQALETPTAEQNALLARYDAPPYVSPASAGAIPFLDIANQFVVTGASFSPEVLAGRSWDQIAASLANPTSDQARGIVGAANVITAAICRTTDDQPAAVCGQPAIVRIEQTLAGLTAPAAGG
ncbi:MAG: DUF929 family protein [Chloroflexi bacterium]|nr:DUF929 family protein [Chloroflexota bacterium]